MLTSSLNQMVPILTSVNYCDWATHMAAYLCSKNLCGYALGNIKKPIIPSPPASTSDIVAVVAAHNKWAAKTGQVMGTIVLKCAPSVLVHLKKENSGEGYWNALKAVYEPKLAVDHKKVLEPVMWQPTVQELTLAVTTHQSNPSDVVEQSET